MLFIRLNCFHARMNSWMKLLSCSLPKKYVVNILPVNNTAKYFYFFFICLLCYDWFTFLIYVHSKVHVIRTRIQETILAGGVQQEAQPKSMFIRGKASPRLTETNVPAPTSPTKTANNGSTIKVPPQQNNIQPVTPQPISPPSVGVVVAEYAVALFDNEVDDDEELGEWWSFQQINLKFLIWLYRIICLTHVSVQSRWPYWSNWERRWKRMA